MYLLFTNEQDAWERSEQEGIEKGLSYHKNGKGSRYVTAPEETADGDWALNVEGYKLDEIEAVTTVPTFTPKPIQEEI